MSADLSKAHPILRARVLRLIGYCEKLGLKLFVAQAFRTREEQEKLWRLGRDLAGNIMDRSLIVTWARPGTSKHEAVDADGNPSAHAVDVAFEHERPWGKDHPWGVVRMIATELCNLEAISRWNGRERRFEGDLGHFEI